MQDTTPLYALIHIPKAAGKTLRAIAHYHYPKHEIVKLPRDGWRAALRDGGLRDDVRLISDVPMIGVHELIDRPVRYITMLRHPTQRVLSYWRYIHHDGGFDDFKIPNVVGRNAMTRAMAGVEHPRQKVTKATLAEAQTNIIQHFDVVGVSERFDESVMLAKHTLGWKAILYQSRNVSPRSPHQVAPPSWVLEMITEQNRYDLQLYDFVRERLDEDIAAMGPAFALEVEAFKALLASEGGATHAAGGTHQKPPKLGRRAYRRHIKRIVDAYRTSHPKTEWHPFRDAVRRIVDDWRSV